MRWVLAALAALWTSSATATIVNVADVDGLKAAIAAATQGNEIVLAGGTYVLSAPLTIVGHGTADAPIVVHAADGATAVIQQSGSNDIFTLQSTSYIVLRNLTLTGGARAVQLVASDHITIANTIIHDIGRSAITANDTTLGHNYVGLVISNNDIYDFGTALSGEAGINLGCASAGCSVTGAVVASSYIHDNATTPVGQGDGILMQAGVRGADVRDNIVVGVNGRGIVARGAGAQSPNLVQRNAIWSTSGVGIDVSGEATIRNNVIIDTATAGLRASPVPGAVQDLTLVNNTILVTGMAMTVTSPQSAVLIADNALFGATALQVSTPATEPTVTANVGSGALDGVASGVSNSAAVNAAFVNARADATELDVFPRTGSPLAGAGDAATQSPDDFNGTTRGSSADVGAYVFASTGNPGWPLAAGFKSLQPAGGDGDASGGDGGGSTSGGAKGPVGPGEAIPIPVTDNKQGCAAAVGSWTVALGVAIWALARRQRGVSAGKGQRRWRGAAG